LATLLQAYTQVSDDEVIEATTMDRRWQLVLDGLDCDTPPFSTRDFFRVVYFSSFPCKRRPFSVFP